MMCTSGSRHCGSCSPATVSGASTLTGTSWVMMVSRLPPPNESSKGASRPPSLLAPVGNAEYEFEDEVVTMVRASSGMLSFFVRRIWADVAFNADLRARLSGPSGTSRLMTLLAADWTVYVSKMVSFVVLGYGRGRLQWRAYNGQGAVLRQYKALSGDAISPTHAHTCVPCSGMMVKHTWSSLSLTHASGPSELSDAVSSAKH